MENRKPGYIETTAAQHAAKWVAPIGTPPAPFADENSKGLDLCYGAQNQDGSPACDGRYVVRVRVFSPESSVPFVTDYCGFCQSLALDAGCTLEVVK